MMTVPYSIPTGTQLLGENVAWELPFGQTWTHAQLGTELRRVGLDDRAARPLAARNVFIRALRKRAVNRLIRRLRETKDVLEFQLTFECRNGGQFDYILDAKIMLDKSTGAVIATDAQLEADVRGELSGCVEARKVSDVTRLLLQLFERNADIFPIKRHGGVYFVPAAHVVFVQQIEAFVHAIGGTFLRFPVPDVVPAASQPAPSNPSQPAAPVQTSVTVVMANGIEANIADYESALAAVRGGKGDAKDLKRAARMVKIAQEKIALYQQYLGVHFTRLEDYAAVVAKRIADEQKAQAAAQQAQQPQLAVVA